MLDLAIKVTALLGAAWVTAFLLRGRAASTRHAVWIGLMAAALALPVIAALAPPVELAWLPAPPPGISQPRQSAGQITWQARVERSAPDVSTSIASSTAPAPSRIEPVPLKQAVVAGWFAVALFLVLRLVASHVEARRILAACSAPSGELAAALASVSAELGVSAPPVRVARTGVMPAVIGILRPSIVLPAEAVSWTAERLRVVLLHECAHVRRRDALLQVVSSVATAAYWWHPLSWLAARQIVRERELACDDLVIASGTSGTTYAEHLLDIARSMRQSNQPSLATLAMARPSELEGRLIALLEERPRDTRPARALALGVALALVAVFVVAPLKLVARAVIADTMTEDVQLAPAAHAEAPARAEPGLQAAPTTVAPLFRSQPDSRPLMRDPAAQAQAAPAPAPAANAAFNEALLEAVNDEDADIRLLALSSLSRVGGPDAAAMLVKALEDSSQDIRRMALLGLIRIEYPQAQSHLARALQDESEDVRTAAVLGLKRLNHPERRAMLLRAAVDASSDVRAMVALALGGEDGADVDAMLVKLSSDASSDVRRGALVSMAQKAGGGARIDDALADAVARGVAGALDNRFGTSRPLRKQ